MKTTETIVKNIATDELAKLGVNAKKPLSERPVERKRTAKIVHTSEFVENDGYTRASTKRTYPLGKRESTNKKKSDPQVLDKKMGALFYAICGMQPDAFEKAHGKADARISREEWQKFTLAITRFIGIAMDARGLQWKSGHEWSLERGDLVRHIEEFIAENAVYVDETDRKYLISVEKNQ